VISSSLVIQNFHIFIEICADFKIAIVLFPMILAGDFNLPHIDWETNTVKTGSNQVNHHQELIEIIEDSGMEQLQLKPSRENNILDLFLTNQPSLVKSCNTIPGISDHNMIIVFMFRLVNNFTTPCTSMFISLILGYFGSLISGSGSCAFSFLKTDLNWSFSSSAFDLLSW
jgi:hypothetical protein